MDERNGLLTDFSRSTTVVIPRKKTKKTTPIQCFCFSIPLLPALLCPRVNGSSRLSRLGLGIILVVVRVNHAIAENGSSEIDIVSLFEQRLAFWGNARSLFF